MKLGAKNWREKDVYASKNSGFILFLLKEMLILAVLLMFGDLFCGQISPSEENHLTYAYVKLFIEWSLEIEGKRCVVKRNLFLSLFSELGAKWQPLKSTGKSKKTPGKTV